MSKLAPAYPKSGKALLAGKTVVVTAAAGTGIGWWTARRAIDEAAQRVAEAALEATVDPVALPSQALHIGLRIGIATTSTPVVAAEVFRAADKALYRAKEAGKGTFITVDLDAARPELVPPHAA